MYFIYKITNQINNKVYVGKAINIEKRWKDHIWNATKKINRYLYDAMNHYGYDNFIIVQIDCCEHGLEDKREIFWIKEYKSNDSKFGYNMTPGGGGGDTLSNHPRKAEIFKQKAKQMKGRVVSQETRDKISKIHKGRVISEKQKKQISKTLKSKYKSGQLVAKLPIVKYGKDHHMFGKTHSTEAKRKMSKSRVGKSHIQMFGKEKAEEIRIKTKKRMLGKNNPLYVSIDLDVVVDCIKDGMLLRDIAKKMNVSYPTILSKFKEKYKITPTKFKENKWKQSS